MLGLTYFPLIIFFNILFFGFSELLVINEEILLLLCFLAFFFNTYIFFGLSIFESFKSMSDLIRLNFFNNFQATRDVTLATLKNFYFAEKKALIFNLILSYSLKAEYSCLRSNILEEFHLAFQNFMEEYHKHAVYVSVVNTLILDNMLYLGNTLDLGR